MEKWQAGDKGSQVCSAQSADVELRRLEGAEQCLLASLEEVQAFDQAIFVAAILAEPIQGANPGAVVVEGGQVQQVSSAAAEQDVAQINQAVDRLLEGRQFAAAGALWLKFMERSDVRPHLVFVPDYNIDVAEQLTQGVDVWINNPRRPWEASGTSGMKVLVNGGLNLSELDGWWAEAYELGLGWAIGDGQEHGSDPEWDRHEAEQVYDLLETEIVPTFYHRNERGVPEKWTGMVRSSMAKLTPYFSTNRTVREYVETYYRPLAEAYEGRVARVQAVGAQVFGWRHNLKTFWNTVHIGDANIELRDDHYLIKMWLLLGEVPPEDVRVEVYAEPEDAMNTAFCTTMERHGELIGAANGFIFAATAPNHRPLRDYSVRVIPSNPNAAVPLEARQILWKNCG